MITKENNKKRLAVDLDINLHCEIKKRAAQRNITVTEYILICIGERIEKEKQYE